MFCLRTCFSNLLNQVIRADVSGEQLSEPRGDWPNNSTSFHHQGIFKPITRKPSTEWLPVLHWSETQSARCQLSLHSDCGVTAGIRNRNRGSIKAAGGCELRESPPSHRRASLDPRTRLSETSFPAADIMPVRPVLEKRNEAALEAELTCSLREENRAQRESYSAEWQCVSLKTQPQDR